jgi:outer membrane protein assembly factor BamB
MEKRSSFAFIMLVLGIASFGFYFNQDGANSKSKPAANTNADWPQWRGPNRDGISKETGLLKSWPASGPKVLWRTSSGEGYSGISIANGRGYTMLGLGSDEVLVCFDAATGKEVWRFKMDSQFYNDHGNGPRSTPTVDGNLVFAQGAKSMLYAVRADNGQKAWGIDLKKEYGAKIPTWGVSTSPLVEGDLVLVDVGGKSGYSICAFNKTTGKLVWNSQTDLPGYSAAIAITANGHRQAVFFTGSAAVSVSPKDGKMFWRFPWETSYDVNAATPIFIPSDKVFISSGYGVGAAVLRIQGTNGSLNVEPVWKSRVMKNHWASSIHHQGYIYGFDDAILACIDANTGEQKWQQRGFNKGSLIFADGHLIILGERGNLALVEATPAGYKEKSSAEVLRGKCWTMPTLAGGKLYVRNQSEMLCLDMVGKKM